MHPLNSFRLAYARRLLAGCFAWMSCAQAGVNLDKLTACDDIASLYDSLKARPVAAREACRAPGNALENALLARTGLDASALCFLRSTPAPFLEGFTCFRPRVKTGASLVCFRPAAAEDIKQYKRQHDEGKLRVPVSNYLSAASACRASKGDSSAARATTFPALLLHISSFELGFITPLGRDRLSDGSVLHAYAPTDPSLAGAPPSAIEVVYLIAGAPVYSPATKTVKVGDWTVRVDHSKEQEEAFNREMRKKRAPLMIDMTTFDLESATTANPPISARLSFINDLQKAIQRSLEDEGFETQSESKIRAATGKSPAEMVEEISRSIPFGARRNSPVKMAPTLIFLLNERRPQCARGGDGAMAAYLMAVQPVPDVRSDYGDVGLIILGMGACARSTTTSTRNYIDGLIDEATTQLVATLRRR